MHATYSLAAEREREEERGRERMKKGVAGREKVKTETAAMMSGERFKATNRFSGKVNCPTTE